MSYDPDKHHRRSIRLRDYDYTQDGAYFVTICAHERQCVFGTIHDQIMTPNAWGQLVVEAWDAIPAHFPQVELDVFVVMPNHIHGIIVIDGYNVDVGAQHVAPVHPTSGKSPGGITPNNVTPGSLGEIVRAFKGTATRRINLLRSTSAAPVWQRNYYEHIIRSEESLKFIRHYVVNNPMTWDKDSLYDEAM